MAIQTLAEFQTTFKCEPVEVSVSVRGMDADKMKVFLKPLTSAQRDAFEASVVGVDGQRDLSNLRARLVANCLVDNKGKAIGNPQQIGSLDARVVGALFDKVRELNGMDAEDSVEQVGKG